MHGEAGEGAGRFPTCSDVDKKFGSSLAEKMAELFNDKRGRTEFDFHVPFTEITFSRVERAVGVFRPLVSEFGLIMSMPDKLHGIIKLVEIGVAGRSKYYSAIQNHRHDAKRGGPPVAQLHGRASRTRGWPTRM